ncbi:MAG: hypothetical protein U0359_05015 [Byssovorax sp.]
MPGIDRAGSGSLPEIALNLAPGEVRCHVTPVGGFTGDANRIGRRAEASDRRKGCDVRRLTALVSIAKSARMAIDGH